MRGCEIRTSQGILALLSLVCALVAALFLAAPAQSQVFYGSIVGTVQDTTGAVVSSASVSIANRGTGESRQTTSNSVGAYNFADVSPGSYDLHVTAPGFRAFTSTNISVTVNTVSRVDVSLDVGQITETVTVAAAAATVQADKADVHVELNAKEVTDLPTPVYRNYQALINLVPGATPAHFQASSIASPAKGLASNINGTTVNNNNNRLDGAINIRPTLPEQAMYVPPIEVIETVNVSTNNFDAEQGFAGGAAVTVTTKSGTNQLHGVAFENLNNSVVNAKDFFYKDARNPKSILNIYGGTLGGPIKKDKLFFFGSYEAMRQRENVSRLLTIPTAAQRAGDFSSLGVTLYDPATGSPDGSGRTPFTNNIIPLNRQSVIAQKMQSYIPPTNQPGNVSDYFASATGVLDRYTCDAKVNWNRTEKNTIWVKYSLLRANIVDQPSLGAAGGNGMASGGNAGVGTGDDTGQLATIGTTYTFTPQLVLDTVLGYTRMGVAANGPGQNVNFGLNVLGIPGTNGPNPRQGGQPGFTITGYEDLGNITPWIPKILNDDGFTYSLNVGHVKSSHDMRFGMDLARYRLNHWHPEFSGFGPRGAFFFNSGVTALRGGAPPNQFNEYAAFLLGLPSQLGKSLQYFDPMSTREWLFGTYFRDRWQVTRKLTVSLGLRWEYYPIMTRAHSGIERYDLATNLVYVGGYGRVPDGAGIDADAHLFAPRFGVAYRLGQKGVIRGGYGMSIDPYPMNVKLLGQPYPVNVSGVFSGANSFQPYGPIENGIPPIIGPDLSNGIISIPSSVETTTPLPGTFRRGYIESYNLILERQLPLGLIGSAGYVGTHTIRQPAVLNVNAGVPGGGDPGRPLVAQFGRVANTYVYEPYQTGNYNSLQVNLTRPFANGLLMKVAYTWSRAIDWTDSSGGTLFFNSPSAIGRNRAAAGFDVPQNFRLAFVYELPFGSGKRWASKTRVEKALLSGWQMNGIFSAYSGVPFTVTASGASLNAPGNSQTADQVLPTIQKLGGIGPNVPYYDPLAFRAVTTARFGTAGRDTLHAPGIVNLDYGLFRTFGLTERFKLQFKAEAFNLSNTPHFAVPSTNASNMTLNTDGSIKSLGNFMSITSTLAQGNDLSGSNRSIRFALRLSF